MLTENFYSDLPAFKNFLDIIDSRNFTAVPKDWYIAVTDVRGSTHAIEAGFYKEVNFIGACSIAAILNISEGKELPFVFGGDGASILIPPSLVAKTQQALLSVRHLAKQKFGLDLRVGIVPVADVVSVKRDIKITKLRISENYNQGIFMGGGLTYATDLLKDVATADRYQLETTELVPKANLFGLECRWQDIPSQHGETISLLIMATNRKPEQNEQTYRQVIKQIQKIYGDDRRFRPVTSETLKLAFKRRFLRVETKVKAKSNGFWHSQMYLLKIRLENLLGLAFMGLKTKLDDMDWGLYKQTVIAATDYKKFDDMLRLIMAGNAQQREQLTHYLETRYQSGQLVYGLHISDRALMTCLIFERSGRQVHFVDGADGGYALAAKEMKRRMQQAAVTV